MYVAADSGGDNERACKDCLQICPESAFGGARNLLCTACVEKQIALRTQLKAEIADQNQEIVENAMLKRDTQVVRLIEQIVNAPVNNGVPTLEEVWESLSSAFGGARGIGAEAAICYRGAKPTVQQKILQLVLGVGTRVDERGTLNRNVEDMETTELEAAALELLEREKRRQKEIDDKTEKEE
jgi:hypothetical protein